MATQNEFPVIIHVVGKNGQSLASEIMSSNDDYKLRSHELNIKYNASVIAKNRITGTPVYRVYREGLK